MALLQGKIGGLVVAKHGAGFIIRKRPERQRLQPTVRQQHRFDAFTAAVAYARSVVADPAQKAVYTAAGRSSGRRAYHLAVADAMHSPAIHDIDVSGYTGRAGQRIVIEATDDFGVDAVTVTVRDATGEIAETGTATARMEDRSWEYTTRSDVPPGQAVVIEVTATDRPGNVTRRTARQIV